MSKCIAAFTPPGADFPPYINASELEDGTVRVIVRASGSDGQVSASIDMSMTEWTDFVIQCVTYAARNQRPSTPETDQAA